MRGCDVSDRITEAELRYLEARDPDDAGEDRWPVRHVQRFGREVRRLRGCLVEWYKTYGHDPDDMMLAPEEHALLAEARAILEEQT